MGIRSYVTITFSAAALLAFADLPRPASATEVPVPTQVFKKPLAAPAARPAVQVARKPFRSVRHSYRPVRYVSRSMIVAPIRYTALEQWRSPSWTHPLFLGVGF